MNAAAASRSETVAAGSGSGADAAGDSQSKKKKQKKKKKPTDSAGDDVVEKPVEDRSAIDRKDLPLSERASEAELAAVGPLVPASLASVSLAPASPCICICIPCTRITLVALVAAWT